jgi:hypothetical protein
MHVLNAYLETKYANISNMQPSLVRLHYRHRDIFLILKILQFIMKYYIVKQFLRSTCCQLWLEYTMPFNSF